MQPSDLSRLADPFDPSDIDWKPGATTRDKSKGLAMAYLSSRAVQQRLDDVCGPADWRNEFREGPGGGVLCGISVRVERADGTSEWVTKWDGSENSQVEAVKGGLSGSMKRAAVQWGVGRYLYDIPSPWVRLDDRGRFAETPKIPRQYLPKSGEGGRRSDSASSSPGGSRPSESRPNESPSERPSPARSTSERPSPGRSGSNRPDPSRRQTPRAGQTRIVRPAEGSSGDGASREPQRPF